MKSRCTVCHHHLIDDINLAILSGDYTLDELSQKFGPSRSAFHRHKGHLEKKMARTLERLENHRKQVSLLKLSAFLDHVQARVEAAAAADDTDRVYKGAHIGSRLIHQINKMDVPLEPDTAYRLLSSPVLASSDSLLPATPQIIADLHQALRDQTLAPCPPPASDEDEEAVENPAADQPGPEKDLPQPLAARETKKARRQHAKARKNRHLLCQKLRQAKHLIQENNLVQNFGAGRECEVSPDPLEISATQAPDPDANVANVGRDPQGGESQSAAPPAAPETSPPADAGLPESAAPPALTNPSSLIPFPCPSAPSSLIPLPCPDDETSRRADELFEISHGYKRHNPPKHIPNRRLDEDFRSRSIFGDVKNVLRYM
jgi:hypothetical protein